MENSKEQGKKKILDEDLAVVSGGCPGACTLPKRKYRAGQKLLITLGPKFGGDAGKVVDGVIAEEILGDKHFDYGININLNGGTEHSIMCLERFPGCGWGGYETDFHIVR